MGSVPVVLWLITIIFLGVIAYAIYSGRKTSKAFNGQPAGFGGWLLLFAIGQTIAPLRALFGTFQNLQYSEQLSTVPGGSTMMWIETGVNTCLFLLIATTTVMMYLRAIEFRRLFAIQWLLNPVVYFADTVLASVIMERPIVNFFNFNDVTGVAAAFIAGGLWYWYIRVSVRVRNTFVK